VKPIVRVRHRQNGEGVEVLIYKKNTTHIFNKACHFFNEIGYNIAAAKIFTTKHNYALNLFDLLDTNLNSLSYEGLFKFIENELTNRLENNKENISIKLSEKSRQARHHYFDTKISISQIEKSSIYQLDVITDDRKGLLGFISDQLEKNQIVIHHAKINTLGFRAEDSFLISHNKNIIMNITNINFLIKSLKKSL
jgi:[protein-PII] uridylyltransferase